MSERGRYGDSREGRKAHGERPDSVACDGAAAQEAEVVGWREGAVRLLSRPIIVAVSKAAGSPPIVRSLAGSVVGGSGEETNA
jgi:hypothetical protein